MKILNFGSINIDCVYKVEHFARPGETILSNSLLKYCGGKGANQSVAAAWAGASVFHAGKTGKDGLWTKAILEQAGVNTGMIKTSKEPTGHAIIQVTPEGENSIILHGGANHDITADDIYDALSICSQGDMLLVQNEINSLPEIMEKASARGMFIAFNPSPITPQIKDCPLNLVNCFVLNEVEATEITGEKTSQKSFEILCERFPNSIIAMTLGEKGVISRSRGKIIEMPAFNVTPIDTTAAGDTFTGYFLAGIASGTAMKTAIKNACKAAAICITRHGAAESIPTKKEVESFRE